MSEGTPVGMAKILELLETGATFEKEKGLKPPEKLQTPVESTRQAFYDAVDAAIMEGCDHPETRVLEKRYHAAQTEYMLPWLNKHKPLIRNGLKQMASLIPTAPHLLHPDVENATAPDILQLSELTQMIVGPDGDHDRILLHVAQTLLSLIAPTANLNHRSQQPHDVSTTSAMFDSITQVLQSVCDGTWYGPTELNGKTPNEAQARGIPIYISGGQYPNNQPISGVVRMGFVPHRSLADGKRTIGEPTLPATVTL